LKNLFGEKVGDPSLRSGAVLSEALSRSPEPMRRVCEGAAKELSNWTFLVKRKEILHSACAPFRMTK